MRSLRGRLRGGERPVLATFVMIPRIEIVELVAAAGFEAVIFDLEHGPIAATDLPPLSAAATAAGIFSIARAPTNASWVVGNLLDNGVDGVLVPHIESGEDARRLGAAGRFAGEGERSLNPFVRGNRYGLGEDGGTGAANERVAVIAMAEGEAALKSFDEIATAPGIDAVFVGPVDLSSAMGYAGDTEHPEVIAAIRELFARAAELGVTIAVYAHEAPAARRWLDLGAGLVALSADAAMAYRGFRAVRAELGELTEPGAAPG